MFKKTKQGYYVLEKFTHQKGLIHGFSTRKFGNMRVKESFEENGNLDKFLSLFKINKQSLVMMEQIHGNKVSVVGKKDERKVIPGIDGMVTLDKGLILGVKTADCLSILFFDPTRKIIGVAHAGWRGILKKIVQKVVDLMIKKGSFPSDILVGIGPFIHNCCYPVDESRATSFKHEFGKINKMVYPDKKGFHLDLSAPVLNQLIQSGFDKENIFISNQCTSCQNEEFFSFRAGPEDKDKRFLSFIGLIN